MTDMTNSKTMAEMLPEGALPLTVEKSIQHPMHCRIVKATGGYLFRFALIPIDFAPSFVRAVNEHDGLVAEQEDSFKLAEMTLQQYYPFTKLWRKQHDRPLTSPGLQTIIEYAIKGLDNAQLTEKQTLTIENRELRRLVKSVEWGSYASTPENDSVGACPSCGGIDPSDTMASCFIAEAVGHYSACKLAAAINPTKPEE